VIPTTNKHDERRSWVGLLYPSGEVAVFDLDYPFDGLGSSKAVLIDATDDDTALAEAQKYFEHLGNNGTSK